MANPLRPVDGVLLLDKPKGLSSNIALQKARHLFRAEKAGHTGTLDPEATGLLPICFGEATKFSSFLLDAQKGYTASIRLGETSSTGDAEGEIQPTGGAIPSDPVWVANALQSLLGPQMQVPPMHSALKRDGKPLYAYAREGKEVERPARAIEIYALDVLHFDGSTLTVQVMCSKGTYIRVLAESIGECLGCGGWLANLRRTHTGGFKVEDALSLEEIAALHDDEKLAKLFPSESLVQDLPRLSLDGETALRLKQGQNPPAQGVSESETLYRIYEGVQFIGIGRVGPGDRLKSVRMMATGGE